MRVWLDSQGRWVSRWAGRLAALGVDGPLLQRLTAADLSGLCGVEDGKAAGIILNTLER